ncbi:prolyl oligopeptidase family serine peptidase [soil metagenome]
MEGSQAPWRRRFRAPRTTLPEWARDDPDRLLYASNHAGRWELFAWDRAAGTHRQVTDRREGTIHGAIDPTGERIWWFDDTDGDEFGRWLVQPFEGGEDRVAAESLDRAYDGGLDLGAGLSVIGRSRDDGNSVHVLREGESPIEIYRHAEMVELGGLSRDERLICIHHSEHGDSRHYALRVIEPDGSAVADLWDGPGLGLRSAGWAPLPGDERLLVMHERHDLRRPLIWWPRTGQTRELAVDLPGDVVVSWFADAASVLLIHEHAGRSELYRLDLDGEQLTALPTLRGSAGPARARPDGESWYAWSDATTSPEIRSTSGQVVLRAPGEPPPAGAPYADLWVGDIHGLVAEPPGPRPHPTVFFIHGGPESHDRDMWYPAVQAWIDHGLAVVHVNYRGSTGYGRAWRDALEGNPGLTELEDIAAVHDRVIAEGIADPQQIVLSGASWGGYLTLLGLGTQPERWALGLGLVPVADYIAAYEDEMEPLKAYDRSLFGGVSPTDDPQRYIDRSPLTYIESVRVPMLILAGENDPRCPIRQIDNYVARLRELGMPHEVVRYDAGHGSLRTEERIRQTEAQLDFVARRLGTAPPR